MMRFRTAAAAAVACLVLSAAPARAQGFISPFLGFSYGGDVAADCASLTNCEEKRINWGVAFGTTHGILGFEEDIGYAKDFFGKTPTGDNAVLTVMSNVMVVVPAGPVRPYAVFGVGLMHPHIQFDSSSLEFSKNAIGYDIGGGLNLFLTHGLGVRGDVRHLHSFQTMTLGLFNDERLDFWRGSAALVFRF
jgi:opacity protein-like surface antigen